MADMLPGAGSIAGSIAGGTVGATAGSALPGPGTVAGGVAGRMAGGVAGGVAGKAAQESVYRALGYGDAPGSIGQEAAFQTKAGATGELLGGAAGLLGRGMIRTGLPAKLADAGRVVNNMVKERIPIGGPGWTSGETVGRIPLVGPMLQSGGREAKRLWLERTASRKAVNTAAGRAGIRIPRQAAIDAIDGLLTKASAEMADDAEIAYLRKTIDSWRTRKGDWLRPGEVQRVITRFNNSSRPVFKAMKSGNAVPEDALQQKAAQRMAVAEALSSEMEKKVPGWREYTSKLGESIAVKDAVNKAEHMGPLSLGSRLAVGSAIGAGAETLSGKDAPGGARTHALLGAALLASPSALSRSGLLLTDPLLQMVLRNAPRTTNVEGVE
jgi:hypothetical protein